MIEAAQVKAARGMLDWTQEQLSGASGVSLTTIRSFESGCRPRVSTAEQIRKTCEQSGVEFTDDGGIRPRKDLYRMFVGSDACDRFFEDVRCAAGETGGEVVAFLRPEEMLRPNSAVHSGNVERLAGWLQKLGAKCLLADMPVPTSFACLPRMRTMQKQYLLPSSFIIHGDTFSMMMLNLGMHFDFIAFRIPLEAQRVRGEFNLLWNMAFPVHAGHNTCFRRTDRE